jgi:hypothetical protein
MQNEPDDGQRPIVIQTQVNVLPSASSLAGGAFWLNVGLAILLYVYFNYGGG